MSSLSSVSISLQVIKYWTF